MFDERGEGGRKERLVLQKKKKGKVFLKRVMRFLQREEDREFKNIKCSDCTNCSDISWSLKKRVFLVFVCGRENSIQIIQTG